mgnify:CR=1 FL=1
MFFSPHMFVKVVSARRVACFTKMGTKLVMVALLKVWLIARRRSFQILTETDRFFRLEFQENYITVLYVNNK